MQFIKPDWPAPAAVQARVTTRAGGVSLPPFDSLNLGDHVGDDPAAVAENRSRLRGFLPAEPKWLRQVHGTAVALADSLAESAEADAAVAFHPGTVCAVLTADCLPVLFCDRRGTRVAAAHAGWRGLAAGVLEASVAAMQCPPSEILAWLGPAIGPGAFEVGPEVRKIFVDQNSEDAAAFTPHPSRLTPHHFMADIYQLARLRLARAGVHAVHGGGLCTYTDAGRFYSYRRDKATGRMASLIWLGAPAV
jgi:YfiH family protein